MQVRLLPPWKFAVGTIALTAALLTWFHKGFTRLQFAKLYALEWAFLISIFLISQTYLKIDGSLPRTKIRETLKNLWPIALFFFIGAFRLLLDLPFITDFESKVARAFAPQYSLIWVYPLFWTGLGYFIHREDPRAGRLWVFLIVLAQAIPSVWEERYHSVALGPILLTVSWIYLTAHLSSPNRFKTLAPWCITIALVALSVLPMWRMWFWNRASRTAFVIGLVLLVFLPLFLSTGKKHFKLWSGWLASLLILTFWGTGMLFFKPLEVLLPEIKEKLKTEEVSTQTNGESVTPEAPSQSNFRGKFLEVMQHSEDKKVHSEAESIFQGRTRKLMWRFTLQQWRQQPIMGVGFMRMVPIIRGPGIINDADRAGDTDSYRPINGTHNSYLTILARMGIVGGLSFVLVGIFLIIESFKILRLPLNFHTRGRLSPNDFFASLLVSGLLGGALYASFNVGFESPQNGFLFWLFAGIIVAENRISSASTNAP